MRKLLGAAALVLLFATPVLAQTVAPQAGTIAPDSQSSSAQRTHDQIAMSKHEHAGNRATPSADLKNNSTCPADSTNEAGGPTTPGGYCLPGGRS